MRRPLLNLHTLYQQAEKADRQDLEALRQYLESHEEYKDWRKEELKAICLKFGINNPCLGDQLYNPNQYD